MNSRARLSRTTLGAFRSLMTDSTVGAIQAAFQDEGFAPNPECAYEDTSSRRITTEGYLSNINWNDPSVYTRVIPVFQRLLGGVKPGDSPYRSGWDTFVGLMARDGWDVDSDGIITAKHDPLLLAPEAIAALKDASAIH